MAKSPARPPQPPAEVAIPTLEDVVVPGQAAPDGGPAPIVLSAEQMQRLSEEIQGIVQAKLNASLRNASQAVSKDLKAYLDRVLPELIEAVIARQREE